MIFIIFQAFIVENHTALLKMRIVVFFEFTLCLQYCSKGFSVICVS